MGKIADAFTKERHLPEGVAAVVRWCGLILGAWGLLMAWGGINDAQITGDWMFGRECPFGTTLVGAHPPAGTEEWCQKQTEGGSFVRHGRNRVWQSDGSLLFEFWYKDGVVVAMTKDGKVHRTPPPVSSR